MSTTNKIIIPNSLKKDIKKYAENIAKSMAKSIRDDMKKEYLYVIEKFYTEYTPKYYFRWDELWNTYEPRLEQRRDSLVIVLPGNGKELHMNTLEILTLLFVVFAALSYLDNHHKK